MTRIVLTDGSGRWFDEDKAQRFTEATYFDGRNQISEATGSQWEHELLYRTKGGVYVLHRWSQWQGSRMSYEMIAAHDAAVWLSENGHADRVRAAGVAEQYAALEVQ